MKVLLLCLFVIAVACFHSPHVSHAQQVGAPFNFTAGGTYQVSGTQYFTIKIKRPNGFVLSENGTDAITYIVDTTNMRWFFNDTSCQAWYLGPGQGTYVTCLELSAGQCYFINLSFIDELNFLKEATFAGQVMAKYDGLYSTADCGYTQLLSIYHGWLGDTLQCAERAADTFYVNQDGTVFAWTQDDGITSPTEGTIKANAYYQFGSPVKNHNAIQFGLFTLSGLCSTPTNSTVFCNSFYETNANYNF